MEKNQIGTEIKKYRKLAGLTQEQLAEKCGLKGKYIISMYERGTRLPTLDKTLPKICDVLGIDFDVVFRKKGG